MLLESGEWDELSLPAIATYDAQIPLTHGHAYHRTAGETLHAARHSAEDLLREKRTIGWAVFAAQYQKQPIPAEGDMIRAEWLRSYDTVPDAGQVVQG